MTTALLLPFAAIAAFVAVRVGGMIWRRPQRGVLLIVAILPFDGLLLLVDLPGIVGGWKEAMTLGLVLATLIAPPESRSERGRPIPAWVGPMLLWVVIGLVWLALGGAPALIGFKISFFYLLLPVVLWRCPFNATERDQLITILMASSVAVALVGIAQQALGPAFLVGLGYEWNTAIRTTNGLLRSIGTFEQPFPFAYFVMTALIVSFPVALADRERRRNRLYLLASPVVVLGMATAIVRGAFVGLAVAVFIIAIYKYRMLVHLAAPALIGLILLSGKIGGALLSSSSLFERTDRWDAVFEKFDEQPFGGGLNASGAAADALREAPIKVAETYSLNTVSASIQPDNYYLKVLVDMGVPGMFCVILVMFFAVQYAWRVARSAEGTDSAMAAGICAALGAAGGAALVSTYFEIFPAELMYWLLLGVLPSLDPSSATTRSRSVRGAAASRPTSVNSSALLPS